MNIISISDLPYNAPEAAVKIANLIENCSKLIICNKAWYERVKCTGIIVIPNFKKKKIYREDGFIAYFDSIEISSWEIINNIPRKSAEEIRYLQIADCYYRYDEINKKPKNYIDFNETHKHNFKYLKNVNEIDIKTQRFGATIEPNIKIDSMLELLFNNLENIKILRISSNSSFLSLKSIINFIEMKKYDLEELEIYYCIVIMYQLINNNKDISIQLKSFLMPELKKIKKIDIDVKVPL